MTTELQLTEPLSPLAYPSADCSPALVYIASLAQSSRGSARTIMNFIADTLTGGACDAFNLPWARLTYAHTQGFSSYLSNRCAQADAPMAPGYARRILGVLRGVLTIARKLNQMTFEQLHDALDFKGVKGDPGHVAGRALSNEELGRLFAALNADGAQLATRNRALMALDCHTGLRRAEICNLDLCDVKAVGRTLMVRRGKGGKTREVPLAGAWGALAAWIELRGPEPGPLFLPQRAARGDGSGFAMRRMTGAAIYDLLRRLAIRAGVAHFSPHDLRRTLATQLFEAGANPAAIQAILGHASISTTGKYNRGNMAAMETAAALLSVPTGEAR